MTSLYALTNALQTAVEGGYVINEDTGEILWSPDELESLELAVQDKAEACAIVHKDKLAMVKAIDNEIKVLQARKKAYQSAADRLEKYIADCVEIAGGEIETPRCKLTFRKSTKVDVFDLDAVPREFIRVKHTEEVNKNDVAIAIKSGQHVPGCALVYEKNLQVK